MALNPRGFDQRRAPQPEDVRDPRVAERDAPIIDGINLGPRPEASIARAPGAGPQAPAGQPGAASQASNAPRMPGQQANGQQTRVAAFRMAAAAPPEAAGIAQAQALAAAAGPDIIDDAEARRRTGLDQDGRLGHGVAVGHPEEVRNPDNLQMALQRAILDPNRGGDPHAVMPQ